MLDRILGANAGRISPPQNVLKHLHVLAACDSVRICSKDFLVLEGDIISGLVWANTK